MKGCIPIGPSQSVSGIKSSLIKEESDKKTRDKIVGFPAQITDTPTQPQKSSGELQRPCCKTRPWPWVYFQTTGQKFKTSKDFTQLNYLH